MKPGLIYDKKSIASALNEAINHFNQYINSLDKSRFENSPPGKWNAGQQLDHLIRSIKPLNLAYALPGFILKAMFGEANRNSKTYSALAEKYKLKLAAGGKASGRFLPPSIAFESKGKLCKRYNHEKEKLLRKIEKISETDLDKYILPHPLLGRLTLREMLFFTIHHNEHHLELVKKYSAAQIVRK